MKERGGRASAVLGSVGEPSAWFEPTRVSTLRQVTAATKVSSLRRTRGLDESPFNAEASTTFVMQRYGLRFDPSLCAICCRRVVKERVPKSGGEVYEGGGGRVMVGVDGCGWVRPGVGESGGSWRWCGRGGPG